MNQGKRFESSLKSSVPEYALLYRLPDSAQSFGGSNNLRFSRKNPFDFFLFDSKHRILFGIEAKTVKGKSISFERNESEHGNIHYHQIQGLNDHNKYDHAVFGFMIEFREIETTIFLKIDDFNSLTTIVKKKSFNYDDIKNSGLLYYVIPQKKIQTRYIYDIDYFLNEYKE